MLGSVITTILFDYSGVLTTSLDMPDDPPFDADKMMTFMLPGLVGTEPHPWHELERGEITIGKWIDYVEAAVPGGGVMFDPDSPLNAMARLTLRDDRIATARAAHDAGFDVGVLTNNVAEWRGLWRDRLPSDVFDVVIDSSDVGMRKPEARIYELAMAELGVTDPRTVAFIDDFEWNVVGAAALGMAGLVCTPELDLAAQLHQLGVRR